MNKKLPVNEELKLKSHIASMQQLLEEIIELDFQKKCNLDPQLLIKIKNYQNGKAIPNYLKDWRELEVNNNNLAYKLVEYEHFKSRLEGFLYDDDDTQGRPLDVIEKKLLPILVKLSEKQGMRIKNEQ